MASVGLSGQRRDYAETSPGSKCHYGRILFGECQCASRSALPVAAGYRAARGSRETVRRFINARSTNEIVFTRGTTESINLLVSSFGEEFMQEGDEVILSVMEHHSNIVPWQLLAAKRGITIKVIPMNDKGELLLDEYRQLFSERTRIVSVAHVSNVLGTVNPVKEMIAFAHEQGVPVLVDGAQSISPHAGRCAGSGCRFLRFSAHKVYGSYGGRGALW